MNYQQQSLAGMNGVELIVALYDGMVRFLYRAIQAIEAGNVPTGALQLNAPSISSSICNRGCVSISEDRRPKRWPSSMRRYSRFALTDRGSIPPIASKKPSAVFATFAKPGTQYPEPRCHPHVAGASAGRRDRNAVTSCYGGSSRTGFLKLERIATGLNRLRPVPLPFFASHRG